MKLNNPNELVKVILDNYDKMYYEFTSSISNRKGLEMLSILESDLTITLEKIYFMNY